METLSF